MSNVFINTLVLFFQGIIWPQVITGFVVNLLNALINYIVLHALNLGVAWVSFIGTQIAEPALHALYCEILFTVALLSPTPFPRSPWLEPFMLISYGKVFTRPPGEVSATFAFEHTDTAYNQRFSWFPSACFIMSFYGDESNSRWEI